MTTTRKNRQQPTKKAIAPSIDGGGRWFIPLIVVLLVATATLVAFIASNRTSEVGAEQTAVVDITGDPIVALDDDVQITDAATDPEAGKLAPTLTGTDFDGNQVTIEPDGRAKVIYFLAHWCPHCQEEVLAVQELISEGVLPGNMDVYAVSTGVDASQANYPPQAWLADESFQALTIRDDADSSAFEAFGGSGFPYAVYLDGDNRIVGRSAGKLGKEVVAETWLSTAEPNN